ncbi:anti-sigma factor [Actinomyces viscosus]|uniref:Putative anti-sigmaE protein n=1 Tax=Actinomyces viscosus TaxID=1656 RepID=A0A3S4VXD5_ACTVI|nr:anti-sigma factor [Actinomyces viscosus]TFH52557.1 anti-sigma factor [Actinomyces viscosus]VEI16356.1 putative anti-sigmaE protein [Actinomyces viscosus]
MNDRENTREDAVNGAAGALGAVGLDGAQGTDDVDTVDDEAFDDEALDTETTETAALLGASLRPVAPPAEIRSALLEVIAREPRAQADGADGAGGFGSDSAASSSAIPAAEHGADGAEAAVVPLDARRRRRSAWHTGLVRAAAAVVLLGVGVGVGRWSARGAVDEAMDSMATSMAPTQHYAHLNQAQDVQRVTDTMPDGHVATLTWSRDMSMTALTLPAAMKESAGGRSLQVWLREGDRTTSLGVYDPRDGAGFSFLDVMPEPGQQIVITLEPAGGSARPTTPPLVTLRVSEDSDRSGATTGSPVPEPATGPTGESA